MESGLQWNTIVINNKNKIRIKIQINENETKIQMTTEIKKAR